MEMPYGMFQCMNKLCKRTYKHKALESWSEPPPGYDGNDWPKYRIGNVMGHSCPFCGSIYVEWTDFYKNWECTEATGWEWKRKEVVLNLTNDTNKV